MILVAVWIVLGVVIGIAVSRRPFLPIVTLTIRPFTRKFVVPGKNSRNCVDHKDNRQSQCQQPQNMFLHLSPSFHYCLCPKSPLTIPALTYLLSYPYC